MICTWSLLRLLSTDIVYCSRLSWRGREELMKTRICWRVQKLQLSLVLSCSSGLWSPIDTASSPNYQPANSFSAFGPNNSFNLTGGNTPTSTPLTPQQSDAHCVWPRPVASFSFQWDESAKVVGASAELARLTRRSIVHLGNPQQRVAAPLAQQLRLAHRHHWSKTPRLSQPLSGQREQSSTVRGVWGVWKVYGL